MASNADWSGYSPPISSKKHLPHPPSKIALLPAGICADEAAWKPGRRVGETSSNASSPSLLGGPVPERDPSVVGSSNWQTETQAMAQTKTRFTSRDQLTAYGKSIFVKGKKSTVPAYELARPFDETVGARLRDENPYFLNDRIGVGGTIEQKKNRENEENGHPNTVASTASGYSLVGYRSGGGARSFLEGLGTEVAASLMSSNTDE